REAVRATNRGAGAGPAAFVWCARPGRESAGYGSAVRRTTRARSLPSSFDVPTTTVSPLRMENEVGRRFSATVGGGGTAAGAAGPSAGAPALARGAVPPGNGVA